MRSILLFSMDLISHRFFLLSYVQYSNYFSILQYGFQIIYKRGNIEAIVKQLLQRKYDIIQGLSSLSSFIGRRKGPSITFIPIYQIELKNIFSRKSSFEVIEIVSQNIYLIPICTKVNPTPHFSYSPSAFGGVNNLIRS